MWQNISVCSPHIQSESKHCHVVHFPILFILGELLATFEAGQTARPDFYYSVPFISNQNSSVLLRKSRGLNWRWLIAINLGDICIVTIKRQASIPTEKAAMMTDDGSP